LLRRVVWQKFTDVSDAFAASNTATYQTTRRNNPEDSRHLNTRGRENLKSRKFYFSVAQTDSL
jgi:hypothetical protein